MSERALLAGGTAFLLPPGAEPIDPPAITPVPLVAPGLLGLAVVNGQALPVVALGGADAFVLVETRAGRVIYAGDSLLEAAPPDARPLPPPGIAARPAPAARAAEGTGWAVPARAARGLPRALAAEHGGARLVLPFAALDRVLPIPDLRPAPGAAGIALGYALADGAPVLVLDPAALLDVPSPDTPGLLVVFRHAGRRLGLPCARIAPARAGEATLAARLDALLPQLGAAPLAAAAAPPRPEATRTLLLCAAGGHPFALPVEEVLAVLPALAPLPAPAGAGAAFRGVATHRGEVLPVLDAGIQLGLAPVLAAPGDEAPLLRLAGQRGVALAVARVTGLKRVPERLISEVAGDGPVAAIAALPEAPLPICRAAVLGTAR